MKKFQVWSLDITVLDGFFHLLDILIKVIKKKLSRPYIFLDALTQLTLIVSHGVSPVAEQELIDASKGYNIMYTVQYLCLKLFLLKINSI